MIEVKKYTICKTKEAQRYKISGLTEDEFLAIGTAVSYVNTSYVLAAMKHTRINTVEKVNAFLTGLCTKIWEGVS